MALLTGSGTAAMEAAVANMVNPGDKVLVLVGGVFGERWGKIARAFGARSRRVPLRLEPGRGPGAGGRVLGRRSPDIVAVFATHNESSTGVINDIEGGGQGPGSAAGRHQALLIVDSVSGLGGAPLPMDEWGVDVVVTGSQKCLMVPPGLSFVAWGAGAGPALEQTTQPSLLFGSARLRKAAAERGETPLYAGGVLGGGAGRGPGNAGGGRPGERRLPGTGSCGTWCGRR